MTEAGKPPSCLQGRTIAACLALSLPLQVDAAGANSLAAEKSVRTSLQQSEHVRSQVVGIREQQERIAELLRFEPERLQPLIELQVEATQRQTETYDQIGRLGKLLSELREGIGELPASDEPALRYMSSLRKQAIRVKELAERWRKADAAGAADGEEHRERYERTLDKFQGNRAKHQAKLEELGSELETMRTAEGRLETLLEAIQSRQAEARSLQAAVRDLLASDPDETTPPGISGETGPLSTPPSPGRTTADAAESDAASALESARDAETTAREAFHRYRAAELAIIREMPIADALRQVDVLAATGTERGSAGAKNRPGTAAELAEFREAAASVLDQMESIRRQTARLAAEVKTGGDPNFRRVAASLSGSPGATARALAEAAEEGGRRAKDLSRLMRGDTTSLPGGGAAHLRSEFRAPIRNLRPARRIAEGSPSADWMTVDSWWVVGPFPNPDRINVDRAFPPESLVDLDASYLGKDGRKLTWDFMQTADPAVRLEESYGIYYAFTEIDVEHPTIAWIAVGSDDNSRLWLNDRLVWKSGYQLKSWRPAEGYRRVVLQSGRNRFLYRVENGWGIGAFSLLVHLESAVPSE